MQLKYKWFVSDKQQISSLPIHDSWPSFTFIGLSGFFNCGSKMLENPIVIPADIIQLNGFMATSNYKFMLISLQNNSKQTVWEKIKNFRVF